MVVCGVLYADQSIAGGRQKPEMMFERGEEVEEMFELAEDISMTFGLIDDAEVVGKIEVEGEVCGVDQAEDVSRSARRHDCEQYAPPDVCWSHARQ